MTKTIAALMILAMRVPSTCYRLSLSSVCFRSFGIPAGKLDCRDQRHDRRDDSDPGRQGRNIEQNKIGNDQHREGQGPNGRDDVVSADKLRAVPEFRWHLFARILQ